ncbi:MAG: ribosome-associated translation inhibitor RaiA [Verrucomicrobiota bacterium]|nr:ribosome-associated translation inhibitor RaiA [Verrucomicrobiota bacterium]
MKRSDLDVIISGDNLDLTEALKQSVREKMEKLFNHENRIIRIRVELGYNHNISRQKMYFAKGMIEIRGPELVVTVQDHDLYAAIDLMENKLNRMLRRRARLHRVKRKDTHDVEIPALIPKVQMA